MFWKPPFVFGFDAEMMAMKLVIFGILIIGFCNDGLTLLDAQTPRTGRVYHGRYTRDVSEPELLIPRHVHKNGKFKSFTLPNFYSRQEINERRKRSPIAVDKDKLHLVLPFNGKDYHVELTPYHDFISPEMVIEIRGDGNDLNERLRFERAADDQCYYRGSVRGHPNSRAALSLCDGVAGHIITNHGRYFIEPMENSQPGSHGQHLHMIYKRTAPHEKHHSNRSCGTGDNWESAWAEQLAKRERRLLENGDPTGLKRDNGKNISSATHSIHRFIEMGVVADKKFLEFWRGQDYGRYLLTIMNMMADFYHDASVGNQIDIVVVRMIYLEAEEKEVDLSITREADATLDSFAAWAEKINPKDHMHPQHFDVALLITRHDICSAGSGCQLLGLAFVAAACDPPKAAGITQDSGLLLGVTASHELGHVVGCSHDEVQTSGCEPIDPKDSSVYIMSPSVAMYTMRWSTCSRKFISTFLNSGLGECLNDDPKDPPDKYLYPNMLPGVMYNADFQCSITIPNAVTCEVEGNWQCMTLWCRMGDKCYAQNGPPAEGTDCGENKWCIKKKCVERGLRPDAVHGGWGGWGPMSECSRTCGGGIKTAERECDNPLPSDGGRYCLGLRRKVAICNIQPCDPNMPSFRAVQCSEFNSKKVLSDGYLHTWAPLLQEGLDPCSLYCVNTERTYVNMGQAKDATPCKAGTKNMCLSGVCREVGCDWELESGAMEDQCGTCKGDGTKCTLIEGMFTTQASVGYAKAITIPKGARGIQIFELQPSQNVVAIKYEHNDTYCLNGNYFLFNDGEYPCAGSRLIYKHPQLHKEEIAIKGPITEDIQLQYVFLNAKNQGISYKYYVEKSGPSEYTPRYLWDFIQWSNCDAKCGGGTMLAQATCIEQENGAVSNNFCADIPRPPPKTRICNENPCPAKWRVSQWSKCSACKGHSGFKTRKVQCVRPAARLGGDDMQIDLRECTGRAPKQVTPCEGTRPCEDPCAPKKSKASHKRDEHSEGVVLDDPENIDSLINMGLAQYLDKAEDEESSSAEDGELKSLLHEWVLANKEKRTCAEEKHSARVAGVEDTQVTEAGPGEPVSEPAIEINIPEADSTMRIAVPAESTAAGVEIKPEEVSAESLEKVTEFGEKVKHHGRDTDSKSISTFEPGMIIRDYVPADQVVLLEAPLKDDSFKANLSDLAFQELGDSVPARLDISKQKIYTGPQAQILINELAYGNITTAQPTYDDTAAPRANVS